MLEKKYAIAKRLSELTEEKRIALSARLAEEGIDVWELPIVATESEQAPLSFAQQRLWFLEQMDPGKSHYNLFSGLRFDGQLNLDYLKQSLNTILSRHSVLRTSISEEQGIAYQTAQNVSELPINFIDLAEQLGESQLNDEAVIEAALAKLAQEEANKAFDLSKDLLLRFALVKINETRHVGFFTIHHIVFDARSVDNLCMELSQLYYGLVQGQEATLPELPIQYKDYALWQQRWAKSDSCQQQLAYWQKQLANLPERLSLSIAEASLLNKENKENQKHQGQELSLTLPADLSKQVYNLASQSQATLYMVMLAAFNLLLSRYSGEEDIAVGTSIANRSRLETEPLIGFLVNLLVMRNEVDEFLSFTDFLSEVNRTATEAYAHQDLPFDQLIDALGIDRQQSHTPLFQVLFVMNSTSTDNQLALPGLTISAYEKPLDRARYDLTLRVFEESDKTLRCAIEFDSDLFTASAIENMLSHYQQLLQGICSDPQQSLNTLSLLNQSEEQKQLAVAAAEKTAIKNQSIVDIFELSVAEHSEANALVYEDKHDNFTYNYSELNQQANQLAHYLREQGVTRESRVALLLERSASAVIGILAVLKAGGTYVPLDTQWPSQRIENILSDSEPVCVLSESTQVAETALPDNVPVVLLDQDTAPWATQAKHNPEVNSEPSDGAYIIYTSGSTGTPKGVVVEHRQLVNYIHGVADRLAGEGIDFTAQSFAHLSTLAADLGNTSLYGALCFGGCLHMISAERAFDPDGVATYMAEQQIDVVKIVPSHLKGLLAASAAKDVLPKSLLILGGEACSSGLLEQIKTLSPELSIVNHYGPSETTVGVLTHTLSDDDVKRVRIPLGRPLPNVQAYVLDAGGHLCPQGVAGELCIGGATVARGYLNRPELNEERFINNPFVKGERLYRTGDRVRLLASGEFDFLGRVDAQVKIRGYRVELGDIESGLRQQDEIADAVVRVKRGDTSPSAEGAESTDQLVAFIVLSNEQSELLTDLSERLAAFLPDYMMPQRIEVLEALPLTVNGKIDTQALDALAQTVAEPVVEHRAASNATEAQLVAIWEAVLRRENIGIDDNFFELGGDSILSLQVIARAKRAGLKLTPKQLFNHQTIAQLADVAKVIESKGSKESKEDQAKRNNKPVTGEVLAAPIQQWFMETEHPERHHWNQSILLQAKQALDTTALAHAVARVVQHHDQLRSEWVQDKQRIVDWVSGAESQYYHSVQWLEAEHNFADEQAQTAYFVEQVNQWQGSLSLAAKENSGQLFKVIHFQGNESANESTPDRLLLVAHHLVVDGVSWRVLLEDLQAAYQAQLSGGNTAEVLPAKTTAFQTWTQALHDVAKAEGEWQQSAHRYWETMAAQLPTQSVLIQREAPSATLGELDEYSSRVDQATTTALLQQAPQAYKTQINDLLLAGLYLAVSKQCADAALYLELEGHGREGVDEDVDVSRTVGWFTSRFPVLLSGSEDMGELIKSVKEQLRVLPLKGMAYGVLRYLGELKALPTPQISFNYLGQVDQAAADSVFEGVPNATGVIERACANRVTHGLSINGVVVKGELSLSWQSVPGLALDVEQLAADYAAALKAIVLHCGEGQRAYTPSDFPLARVSQSQLDALVDQVGVEQVEDVYPLTPMQEGLMLHTLLSPGTGIYFMQYRYEINGHFNHRCFIDAWQQVVDRHQLLRTAFLRHEDQTLQVVYRKAEPPVTILDWRDLSQAEQEQGLSEWMQQKVKESFDLSVPTQLAITLIRVGEEKYQLIRSFHHILMDAWCFSLLMRDFIAFYQTLILDKSASSNKDNNLSLDPSLALPSPRPYRDYIAWLQRQDINKAEVYWRESLAGFTAPTQLAITSPQSTKGVKDHVLYLNDDQTQQLQSLAQHYQITVNTIVQGAWGLVLNRYSGDQDLVFGVTVAGRPTELEGADDIIGLFINSLPLRLQIDSQQSVSDYLQQVLSINHGMREFEFAPLADIQRWSDIAPGKSLFDTLFVYENAPVDHDMGEKLAAFELVDTSNRTHTNYPITVVIYPQETLGLQLTYDCALFEDESVARMLQHFKQALLNLAEALEQGRDKGNQTVDLKQIDILSEQEQRQVLVDWNQTYTDYPRERCWQQLFDRQVMATPDATAVVYQGKQLSYAELQERTQRLASVLVKMGVKPNQVVAVLDQRGIDLLVMIIAVLKAGAAYLPLDPKHPEKRLATVISSSQPALVIASDDFVARVSDALTIANGELKAQGQSTLTTFIATEDSLTKEIAVDAAPLSVDYRPDQLAYVIYTSGSTGLPKGAMVEHLGMLNNIYAKIPHLSLTEDDRIAQTASQCFDISVWQFLTALICGAQVHIYPDEIAHHPIKLLESLEQDQITVLESVPSLIYSFLETDLPLSKLRWLMPTGEALTVDLAKSWLQTYPHIPLINAYGPAECADDVAFWVLQNEADTDISTIPIGRPTDNNRLYVLSAEQQLQGIGLPGEIYVAGAGVGRGYLNDAQRTEDVFLNNFLLEHPQHQQSDIAQLDQAERLYRTGDLARWRDDGVLEYLGRTDHQVKIRGFRIELGEIEACLEEHSDIYRVAVVTKPDPRGDLCLVAYYQVNKPQEAGEQNVEAGLIDKIKQSLPEYMLPSLFVALEKMPLNNNGKIDRHALPEPDFINTQQEITEPRTETEHKLVEFWKEVLKIDRVDIHSSFFVLGGHSLLAVQLHAKICHHFEVELSLRSLFEHNSVAAVAEQIELAKAAALLTQEQTLEESDSELEEFEI